jgi:glucose dehydrogenase
VPGRWFRAIIVCANGCAGPCACAIPVRDVSSPIGQVLGLATLIAGSLGCVSLLSGQRTDLRPRRVSPVGAASVETGRPMYGHDAWGLRYSPLTQITPENVARLERAWTFHTGKSGSEATPLVISGVMYTSSPDGIFALEPRPERRSGATRLPM